MSQRWGDYGMPGSLWFEVWLPCPLPLSRAVISDMTRSDLSSLSHHPRSLLGLLHPGWTLVSARHPASGLCWFPISLQTKSGSEWTSRGPDPKAGQGFVLWGVPGPAHSGARRKRSVFNWKMNQWLVLVNHTPLAPSWADQARLVGNGLGFLFSRSPPGFS